MLSHHRLDIYGVELHLATTRREWATLRRRLDFLDKTPSSNGISCFAVWEPKRGCGVRQPHLAFWLDAEALTTDMPEFVETMAHEAAHGAGQILHWTGHDFRGENGSDEPHAYLVGWLTRWMWEQVA